MHTTAVILSIVVGIGMLMSGSLKILRAERIVRLMSNVGVTGRMLPVLGSLQVAATIGLISGLWFAPLGIAAAGGLVLYFAGAVGAHVRAKDPEWQGAALFLLLSAVTLAFLIIDAV